MLFHSVRPSRGRMVEDYGHRLQQLRYKLMTWIHLNKFKGKWIRMARECGRYSFPIEPCTMTTKRSITSWTWMGTWLWINQISSLFSPIVLKWFHWNDLTAPPPRVPPPPPFNQLQCGKSARFNNTIRWMKWFSGSTPFLQQSSFFKKFKKMKINFDLFPFISS